MRFTKILVSRLLEIFLIFGIVFVRVAGAEEGQSSGQIGASLAEPSPIDSAVSPADPDRSDRLASSDHYRYFFLPPNTTPQQQWLKNERAFSEAPSCVYAPFMDVESIARDYNLSLFEAVEVVQNYYQRVGYGIGDDRDFLLSVEQVRKGKTSSGLSDFVLRAARFIVAVDIDHTLLDQSVSHAANPDHSFPGHNQKIIHVRIAPGAFDFLNWIREVGGVTVLMSRSASSKVTRLVAAVGNKRGVGQAAGIPLREMVDGVMGYRHLLLTRDEWQKDPARMSEAYSYGLKKDLRVLGSEYQDKVIIIDDEPRYVRHKRRVFMIPPFFAEAYDQLSSSEKKVYNEQRFARAQRIIHAALHDSKRPFGAAFERALMEDEFRKRVPRRSVERHVRQWRPPLSLPWNKSSRCRSAFTH